MSYYACVREHSSLFLRIILNSSFPTPPFPFLPSSFPPFPFPLFPSLSSTLCLFPSFLCHIFMQYLEGGSSLLVLGYNHSHHAPWPPGGYSSYSQPWLCVICTHELLKSTDAGVPTLEILIQWLGGG